jgi:uncharacterized protein YjdB
VTESPSPRRGPARARFVAILAGVLLLVAGGCRDTELFNPNTRSTTRLVLQPYFAVNASSSSAVDINRIRVTVLQRPGGEVVDVEVVEVNPTATSWNLDLDVPANADLTLLIELMNGDAVQYSGRLEVSTTSGDQPPPAPIPVFPGPPENLNVTSVSISPRNPSVLEGDPVSLTASVIGGAGSNSVVTWASLTSSVATVAGNGTNATVTTRLPGQTVITAFVGPRTDNITITVGARATGVVVTPANPTVHSLNMDVALTAAVVDARNGVIAGIPITAWTVEDQTIARQVSPGVFRTLRNGSTRVTAFAVQNGREISGSTLLTVAQLPLNIVLDPAQVDFASIGATRELQVSATDGNNNPVTGIAFTWSSLDEAVATVDQNGVVTARGAGSTRVRAAFGSTAGEAVINVQQVAARLVVTPGEQTLTSIGETVQLRGEIQDAAGNPIPGPITWTSSLEGIASVDANGLVTARGDGVTVISASGGGRRGNATIRVERVVRGVAIDPNTAEVAAGATVPLNGYAVDANGHQMNGVALQWSSAQPSIATVNASTGVVTGVSSGDAVITASAAGFSANATVTVSGAAAGGPGYFSGRVVDHNGTGVQGAQVRFIPSTGGQATNVVNLNADFITVTTDSNGNYTSPLLNGGLWDIEASKAGYTTTVFHGARIVQDQTTTIESLIIVPTSPFPGSISGTVRNARTLSAISGATVELRIGQNNTTGPVFASTTSNGSGFYEFTGLPAQVYTLLARPSGLGLSEGFRTGVIVGNTARTGQDIILTPLGNPSEIYIVLTWGQDPRDLDSHLTGPNGSGGRFHVYYAAPGTLVSSPFASLDVDDTSGFGPETITISQVFAGTYRYYIHHYSGAQTIATSSAVVRVYRGANLLAQFSPPNQPGLIWYVFDFDGTNVIPVQTISNSAPARRSPFDITDTQRVLMDIQNHSKRDF